MLYIPHKLAPSLAEEADVHACGLMLDTAIHEALEELADQGKRAGVRLARLNRQARRASKKAGARE